MPVVCCVDTTLVNSKIKYELRVLQKFISSYYICIEWN